MELSAATQDSTQEASQPSIVEHFSIDGLFGYRSVSLSSKYAATVLIARNGSGKTTLIAALDAFLRGQFARFVGLQFEKVTCQLRDFPEPLVLHRSDIVRLADVSVNVEIAKSAIVWEVEPLALLELVVDSRFKQAQYPELIENTTFNSIYTKMRYEFQGAKAECERLAASVMARNPNLVKLWEALRSALGNTEIVYLPTYRRIELSLGDADTRRPERRRSVLARLGIARSGLQTADIQFGLGDISDRLKSLYSEMLYLSNQGYGKVSANVINALISGDYNKDAEGHKEPPTREALELFFLRIKEGENEYGRRIPYSKYFETPDLDRVYSGDVPEDAKPFLSYFLDQLNSVIQKTKGSEELVEAFISNCNRYLSGVDQSTDKYSNDTLDSKRLTFNRRNFKVKVTNSATGSEVPLESLSSGEKQMISLFARLYLYPGPKIVLIDEPELSLSLDWQRQILPDILKAPTCKQAIAITHSPFIFDNELERFAGSLQLRVSVERDALNVAETDSGDGTDEDQIE